MDSPTAWRTYDNPLGSRYASDAMLTLFSPLHKYTTWRRLWIALAKAQQQAGLPVHQEQLDAMKNALYHFDATSIATYEKRFKHEVMAHIHSFADACPVARPIIHLGETSMFVLDNGDCIIHRDALLLLEKRLLNVLASLASFAKNYRDTPCLSYTHLQVAQPSTIGKRFSLWMQSFLTDFHDVQHVRSNLKLRGIKGTTGTAASFKALLQGDYNKLMAMDAALADSFSFTGSYTLTGQTYDRKVDCTIMQVLNTIAISAHKITNDLRFLSHTKEIEESFGDTQVGSSAMPYKRNPILCERIASLAKFVFSLSTSPTFVASSQFLERTLDDSANKRLALPQAFLAVDAILTLLHQTVAGLRVNTHIIARLLTHELPFMVTEDILMHYVNQGGDRQTGHELIRTLSQQAIVQMRDGDLMDNPLFSLLLAEPRLGLSADILTTLANPFSLAGFSAQQVDDFLNHTITPLLAGYEDILEEPLISVV